MSLFNSHKCPICENYPPRCKCELGRRIDDESWKIRQKAVKTLAKKNLVIAIPHIIHCLSDEFPEVREEAANALGSINKRRAVKPLCDRLNDSSEAVQLAVLNSLAIIRDSKAIANLIQRYKVSPNLQEQVIVTINKIADFKALNNIEKAWKIDSDVDFRLFLLNITKEIDHPKSVTLLSNFHAENEEMEFEKKIVEILGSYKNQNTIDSIILALHNKSARIRTIAVESLASIKPDKAVRTLVKLAAYDEDDFVRILASDALMELSSETSIKTLLELLESEDVRIRRTSVKCLENSNDQLILIPILLHSIEDSDETVRIYANKIISRFSEDEIISELLIMLNSEDQILKNEVSSKLKEFGWTPKTIEEKLKFYLGLADWSSLVQMGQDAVNFLMKLLNDVDSKIRAEVADCLGQIGDSRAIGSLINSLNDDNEVVRSWASKSLGRLKAEEAIAKLAWLIDNDDDEDVILVSIESLSLIQTPRSLNKLIDIYLFSKNDVLIDEAKSYLIVHKSEKIEDILISYLGHSKENIRLKAIDLLNNLEWTPRNEEEETLLFLVSKDWKNIKKSGKRAELFAIQALKFDDEEIVLNAIDLLVEIKSSKAFDNLEVALNHGSPKVRLEAINAIGKLELKRALQVFIKCTTDPDIDVASAAISYLALIKHPSSIDTLLDLTRDEQNERAETAQDSINQLIDNNTISKLKKHIMKEDYGLQRWAIKLAGISDSVESFKLLDELTKHTQEYVKKEAIIALSNRTEDRVVKTLLQIMSSSINSSSKEIRKLARTSLLAQDIHLIRAELLQCLLTDDDGILSSSAGNILKTNLDTLLIDYLGEKLMNKTLENRWKIIQILSNRKNDAVLKILIMGLENESRQVRIESAKTLLTFRDRRVVNPLMRYLELNDEEDINMKIKNRLKLH